jgi:hypothetical protein
MTRTQKNEILIQKTNAWPLKTTLSNKHFVHLCGEASF